MIAIGVGGLDAAETMAGMPWELMYPKRIGVYLTGYAQQLDRSKGYHPLCRIKTYCVRWNKRNN